MSVTVRPYRRGGWTVDVITRLADGRRYRERRRLSVRSQSAAHRWGEDRERHVLQHGPPQVKKEVPTLEEFAPRFIDGHARANRQKPSGIAAKETILKVHLVPLLGTKKLDAIRNEDVQRLKSVLSQKSAKTVNNVLAVLGVLLKKAVEWEVLERLPCSIRLLPVSAGSARFHDFDEYERLVKAAHETDRQALVVVLLGGEAGLRCGEMMAMEWTDVDLVKRQLCVARSEWKGHVTVPKGGRLRYVPLTARLSGALREHRHLRGSRVLCERDGSPLTQRAVQGLVLRAARRANLRNVGVHVLRHTFCSHLAMRGAPTRAIQELAGHRDLVTTQHYMHLSPSAVEDAIRLLEHGARGNMVATSALAGQNINK
ncbi:MAG: tyrosine-type recombinase/integrase [Vicinamibacterales bacterium]